MEKLQRLPEPAGELGGVCAGMAYHLKMPTWGIRLITVLLLFSGVSVLFYLLLWILMPEADTVPEDYEEICE